MMRMMTEGHPVPGRGAREGDGAKIVTYLKWRGRKFGMLIKESIIACFLITDIIGSIL